MNKKEKEIYNRLNKLIPLIKPDGVLDITFKIEQFDDNRFHCNITFIVPDDSEYLKMTRSIDKRIEWSREITDKAWLFLNIRLIPSSTSISSKSHIERQKLLDEGKIKSRQNEALDKIQKMLI